MLPLKIHFENEKQLWTEYTTSQRWCWTGHLLVQGAPSDPGMYPPPGCGSIPAVTHSQLVSHTMRSWYQIWPLPPTSTLVVYAQTSLVREEKLWNDWVHGWDIYLYHIAIVHCTATVEGNVIWVSHSARSRVTVYSGTKATKLGG